LINDPTKRNATGGAVGSTPRGLDRLLPHLEVGVGSIRSDVRGFDRLGSLHRELSVFRGSKITVDLSKLDWFDGHMVAPMRVVVQHAEAQGNVILFTRPRPDVETVLRKNGFLAGAIPDHHHTTMPLTQFDLNHAIQFSLYAKKHLARPEMPKMSDALRGKFFEGVDELFANAALHSKSSQGVAIAGQFYPKQGRLDFTLTDGGRGIPGSIRAAMSTPTMSDPRAIDWAMQDYNTTRQGDIPGGLGSKILRDFIKLNGGKLLIASNGGFWCQDGPNVQMLRIGNSFPGTAVMLEVNTADKGRYDLIKAPNPQDIW
jgi:hypothetical protein